MPVFHPVTLSALFLEHYDFIALNVFQYLSGYHGVFNHRRADLYLTVIINKQYLGETHGVAFGLLQTVYEEFLFLFDLKLLSCYLYNCVHQCFV